MSELWREQVRRDRDPELVEINRLALARIHWFENEIEKNYHLQLRMGCELEMLRLDADGNLVTEEKPRDFELSEIIAHTSSISALLWDRAYSDSKGATEIATGYRPLSQPDKQQQSKRQSQNGTKKDEARYRLPSYQATLADRLKQYLSHPENIPRFKANSVVFTTPNPSHEYGDITLAFQPNISVWTRDGRNLFGTKSRPGMIQTLDRMLKGNDILMEACASATVEIQQQTALLGANYPGSYDQFYNMNSQHIASRRSFGVSSDGPFADLESSTTLRGLHDPKLSRLENRIPRADSNPVLAVLQSVAGVYYALENATELTSDKNSNDRKHEYYSVEGNKFLKVKKQTTFNDIGSEEIGTHYTNHQIFQNSELAKRLLGLELHTKIAAYFSPEAIAKREAALVSGARCI